MQDFDAIRPYGDDETGAAIARLLDDPAFLELIGRFKSPRLNRLLPGLVRVVVKHWLRSRFLQATCVDDLQKELYQYVDQLVRKTTSRVTSSGLDRLDSNTTYLFISNHRDIVFDPMVVNYLLYRQGLSTTRIAIGDNLLKNRLFAELMRLNKSFVVQRNITSPREMRNAYLTLSSFISHSLDTGHSIWIAQREGRAKDGMDHTDPAIIKMFYMGLKKSGMGFAEAMNQLRIVPVSIAYEYDPCDLDKARELEIKARTGEYVKAANEDTDHIVKGLTGFKGHVHVHFGTPISESPDNAKDLARLIDREMHANYRLHASNLMAYQQTLQHPQAHSTPDRVSDSVQTREIWSPAELEAGREELNRRLNDCVIAARPYLLAMYANPVLNELNARTAQDSFAGREPPARKSTE